jgi:TfoX/Sxy family transcriptional regulator of competence genes
MATMKWTKPSAETIAYFERIAPGPPLETRQMFGMPCRFLNGHMLVGVFQNSIMLRLSEDDRFECLRAGATPFVPMGRAMKEYVEIAPGTFDDREMKEWIVRGMRFLASLEPKLPKVRKTVRSAAVSAADAPTRIVRAVKLPATQQPAATKTQGVKAVKLTGANKAVRLTGANKAMTATGASKSMTTTGAMKAAKVTGGTKAVKPTVASKAVTVAGGTKAVKLTGASKAVRLTGGTKAVKLTGANKAVKLTGASQAVKTAKTRGRRRRVAKTPLARRASARPPGAKRGVAKSAGAKRAGAQVARAAEARNRKQVPALRAKAKPSRRARRK